MKEEYIKKTLLRIKEYQDNLSNLNKFGIELLEYYSPLANCLEESIAILLAKDDKQFELILDDIQWWLYEGVDKIISFDDGKPSRDLNSVDDYVKWLIEWYESSQKPLKDG